MINAEKYKAQLLKFVKENHDSLFGLDKNSEPISCAVSRCNNCQFGFKKNNYIEGYSCSAAKIKWLLSEYKEPVKLSKLEYDILNYLLNDTGYRYIVRDKYYHEGDIFYLYIFKNRPREDSGEWHSNDPYDRSQFYAFNNLFKFIKFEDEKPTSIQDVLNNCEVVNDAKE